MTVDKAELFEVGDKVRVVNPDEASDDPFKDCEGVITMDFINYRVGFTTESGEDYYFYADHELEAA